MADPRALAVVLVLVAGCSRRADTDENAQTTAEQWVGGAPSTDSGKRLAIEELLTRGPVLVHLDARRTGVVTPAKYHAESELVLRIGYKLSPAIGDLVIDDKGIAGTLLFDGQPFRCVVPWSALYAAIVEGEPNGTVWAADLPAGMTTPVGAHVR